MSETSVAVEDLATVLLVSRGDLPEETLAGWQLPVWREILLDLPPDGLTFLGRYGQSWSDAIDGLAAWVEPPRQETGMAPGFVGLVLLTLLSLRHSDERRQPRHGEVAQSHDCDQLCRPLLRKAPVREALRLLYAPAETSTRIAAEWDALDFDSLAFHRHGTTSFILSGVAKTVTQGQRRPFALKCLIYPFLRVPVIVQATREYMSKYQVLQGFGAHTARVWESSDAWIVMDFVAGETLAEHLAAHVRPGDDLRIDLLTGLGRELFAAMTELEAAGLSHGDLSPTNIILSPDNDSGVARFVLIDLGVNYLYNHAVSGSEGPDAKYVAPEVRSGEHTQQRSDLYSVGQMLIVISGASSADGSVPDLLYSQALPLARFIEDLVDIHPHRRLAVVRPDLDQRLYPQLRRHFAEELEAVAAVHAERGLRWGPRWLRDLVGVFTPLAGAPGRQRRIWQIRRRQQLYREPRRSMYVRWLLAWSWVSAVAWYLGAALVIMWWLRDLEWDWGNQLITALQRVTGARPDEFPILDSLRQYPIPDLPANLPVRLTAFSFLMVGARFYQNIFSGLTPLATGRNQGTLSFLALLAEISMRVMAVLAIILALAPTLIQRDWWPIYMTIGMVVVFFVNLACLLFAQLALNRAADRNVASARARRVSSLESFAAWTPSQGFYAGMVAVIGFLIYTDAVKDVYVYAAGATAVNVVLFYLIKCSGASAANVRVGLGRAILAAERLRYISETVAPPKPRRPIGVTRG